MTQVAVFPFAGLVPHSGSEASESPAGVAPSELDDLGLSLLLNAIDPAIGGVLIVGQKGTAKSTAVRGLAELLPEVSVVPGCAFRCAGDPHCPEAVAASGVPHGPAEPAPATLVELPLGASEDRLIGSLEIAAALSHGVARLQPGLIAAAHQGILYVDEVNLLSDHLVDVLLDVAASGVNKVERDGISLSHAARFGLVGTMNPEEGELRPQLLDRFGLSVEVVAPQDPHRRREVVRRRLDFDRDPAAFRSRFADASQALRERLVAAKSLAPQIVPDDAHLLSIAEICVAYGVEGLRADVVMARTACAHAAWQGRTALTNADLKAAARLALPHRRRTTPFDDPGPGGEPDLDDLLPDEPEPDQAPGPDQQPSIDQSSTEQSSTDQSSTEQSSSEQSPSTEQSAEAGPKAEPDPQAEPGQTPSASNSVTAPIRARRPAPKLRAKGLGATASQSGRRSPSRSLRGRSVGSSLEPGAGLHLLRTLVARATASDQPARFHRRVSAEANLIVLVVDASGSLAARRRMGQVKGAVLSLLTDAYQRRDQVCLITFRGDRAEVALPPTRSPERAQRRLADLPAGGRTPLAAGLTEAAALVRQQRRKSPQLRPLVIVLTDGRATSARGQLDPTTAALAAADELRRECPDIVVLDCEQGRMRLGLARALATRLAADYRPLTELVEMESEVRRQLERRERPSSASRRVA